MEAAPVEAEGATGCRMRCLIGPDDAAPSFSMRQFELAPGGNTPRHSHAHEHEMFILEGEGVVFDGLRENPVRSGYAVFVPPNQAHQVRNTGTGVLKFLCLIPHPLRGMRGVCTVACGCDG
jgi:quercetin dioxygenase-like cupin family protein